jgi:hypothetical protein
MLKLIGAREEMVQMDSLPALLASLGFVQYPRNALSCEFVQLLAMLGTDGETGRLRREKIYLSLLAGLLLMSA